MKDVIVKNDRKDDTFVIGKFLIDEQIRLYYWTGKEFSTNRDNAEKYTYGNAAGVIWDGPLWERTEELKALGLLKLHAVSDTAKIPDLFNGPEIHFTSIKNKGSKNG